VARALHFDGANERGTMLRTHHQRLVHAALAAAALGGCMGSVDDGFPSIVSVEPAAGSARGGALVTISGTGFADGARVLFGGIPAPEVTQVSPGTVITATTPPGVAGPVDVTVETPAGAADVAPGAYELLPLDVAYTDYTALFPTDAADSRGTALADLDGDGDLDLAVSVRNAPNRLLLNDGAGNFSAFDGLPENADPLAPVAEDTLDIGAADLDQDGDVDLYVANYSDQPDRLYLNDGAATFTDASDLLPSIPSATHGVAFADVDGDGDLDVLLAENGVNHVLRNLLDADYGVFGFEEIAGALPPDPDNTVALTPVDVEGDGDLDLVAANHQDGETVRLYLNDGSGLFTAAPDGQIPVAAAAGAREVVAADLTGDGAPDLLVLTVEQDRLYVNDGMGFFFDDTIRAMPYDMVYSSAAAVFDADRDGDLDAVIANNGASNRLYLNDGTGLLRDYTVRLPDELAHSMDVAAGDFDGDGDTDLFFANDQGEQDALYLLDAPWGETGS